MKLLRKQEEDADSIETFKSLVTRKYDSQTINRQTKVLTKYQIQKMISYYLYMGIFLIFVQFK